MYLIRIFSFGLLVALIGITSQTMAVSRGHAAATGQIVLCTGAGLQTIQIDAEGNPTQGGHYCPDCVLVAWVASETQPMAIPQGEALQIDTDGCVTNQTSLFGSWGLGARGPPFLI